MVRHEKGIDMMTSGVIRGQGAVYVYATCIPYYKEKYISFSLKQLRFIDSVQFLLVSLDCLVTLNKPEPFHITPTFYPDPS